MQSSADRQRPGPAALGLSPALEEAGVNAAGVLAVCPYYNRPSQAGIEAHMRAIADASDLPVMVYDIPIRTGRKMTSAMLLRLAREVPNVVALKDAAANPGETFEGTVARTALRRLGQPGDIAAVVAFLAGPDSGWISGQNLAADGGLLP